MAIEAATYISQLVAANPPGSDNRTTADDHLRLIKSVLLAQFPSLGAAAVNATAAQINYLVGVTSAVQTQIDAKAPSASPALTGTPTAPTAATGTGGTQVATCGFTQAAIAAVNANGSLVLATDSAASVVGVAGQHTICTNASAVTFTLPGSPSAGDVVRVTFTNTLYSNVVDPGAEKIRGVASTRSVNRPTSEITFTYTGSSYGWSY